MERLWAPWRMIYIKQNRTGLKKCVFCCKLQKNSLKKLLVLSISDFSYVIMNKYPYISGHLMVVPKRHVADFEELRKEEGVDLFFGVQKTIRILKKVLKPQGINVGLNLGRTAGAGIDQHLHYHVVPRWHGDTNFMPVISHSKVISESLDRTYQLLVPYFHK